MARRYMGATRRRVLLALLFPLVACVKQHGGFRYRLTVHVDTPQGRRSASGEFTEVWRESVPYPPDSFYCEIVGAPVAVDLGEGHLLVRHCMLQIMANAGRRGMLSPEIDRKVLAALPGSTSQVTRVFREQSVRMTITRADLLEGRNFIGTQDWLRARSAKDRDAYINMLERPLTLISTPSEVRVQTEGGSDQPVTLDFVDARDLAAVFGAGTRLRSIEVETISDR